MLLSLCKSSALSELSPGSNRGCIVDEPGSESIIGEASGSGTFFADSSYRSGRLSPGTLHLLTRAGAEELIVSFSAFDPVAAVKGSAGKPYAGYNADSNRITSIDLFDTDPAERME